MLMKPCLCIIAFEVAKRNHEETKYNFSDYRIPINVEEVYKHFNSISYKARRAMRAVYKYFLREKDKLTFFDHNESHENYQKYAERVFSQCEVMQENVKVQENKLEVRKEELKDEIRHFYKVQEENKKNLKKYYEIDCSDDP